METAISIGSPECITAEFFSPLQKLKKNCPRVSTILMYTYKTFCDQQSSIIQFIVPLDQLLTETLGDKFLSKFIGPLNQVNI